MENAINLARDGGWYAPSMNWFSSTPDERKLMTKGVLLDPLFWQALGKALEWPKYSEYGGFTADEEPREIESWLAHWHLFIDHLASGKDVDSFFKELLT